MVGCLSIFAVTCLSIFAVTCLSVTFQVTVYRYCDLFSELMANDSQILQEADPAVAIQELIGNAEHFQRDIECLRTFIRDTYAERMGRTAVCTVQ